MILDDDIRIIRRVLNADLYKRVRTLTSIINQYMSVVKPMYHQFIETNEKFADIIPEGGSNRVAIDLMTIKKLLQFYLI